jgi:hypothetical protein
VSEAILSEKSSGPAAEQVDQVERPFSRAHPASLSRILVMAV